MTTVTCGPNVTASRIRRVCGDCCLRRYRVDPTYGIPAGTPPLCVDPTSNMVRPASSFVNEEAANPAFVGFSNEYFPPGEDHLVWVHTCGWVEMELETPAAVAVGDRFKLTDDDTNVSNSIVVPEDEQALDGIFEAVEACWCEAAWTKRAECLTDVPEADDLSPTDAPEDQITQRTVILQFGSCCRRQEIDYGPF